MRHGVYLAPFGELADPSRLGDLAAEAEQAGFEGVFLWDHVARPHKGLAVAHVGVSLAVIAERTARVRFGALVTPLARRRPQDFARETTSLDHLSGGRLVVGVGLGVNTGGELERFGEEIDPVVRAARLDEAIDVVLALWSGEVVRHRGRHFLVDEVAFSPVPLQTPRVPMWAAARDAGRSGPVRRAARLDGLVPETDLDGLGAMLEAVAKLRGGLDGFEVVCKGPPETRAGPFQRAGATWWLAQLPEVCTFAEALRVVRAGPQ